MQLIYFDRYTGQPIGASRLDPALVTLGSVRELAEVHDVDIAISGD